MENLKKREVNKELMMAAEELFQRKEMQNTEGELAHQNIQFETLFDFASVDSVQSLLQETQTKYSDLLVIYIYIYINTRHKKLN